MDTTDKKHKKDHHPTVIVPSSEDQEEQQPIRRKSHDQEQKHILFKKASSKNEDKKKHVKTATATEEEANVKTENEETDVKSPRKRKENKHHPSVDPGILPPVWTSDTFSDPTQREKLKLFRNAIKDYIVDDQGDLDLARWLIARKWDVAVAADMYIAAMKWREKENIDNVMDWISKSKSFKFLSEYWPLSILPEKNAPPLRTYDGYQVIYERLCMMSPHLLQVVTKEDMMHFHFYHQELTSSERKKILNEEKDGTTFAASVFIQDLAGLTMSHLTGPNFNMVHVFADCDSKYYPETLRRVYFINAPSVFNVGWKLVKRLITDPATIDKVVILGVNFKDELRKFIPPESLPIEYGGTLDFLPSGGGSLKDVKSNTQMAKLFREEVVYNFSITLYVKAGSNIGWQFRTKHYDIAFGVFYSQTEDGEKESIHDLKREESHKNLIEGLESIAQTGYYTLTWDNSYSWSRGKHLKYLVFLDGHIVEDTDIVSQTKK